MLTGTFRGVALGCGTDVWRLSEEVRAGTLSAEQFTRSESAMIRSRGHCNTMGTASTMALVAEALGTVVPGVAGHPPPTVGCWRPRTGPVGWSWRWSPPTAGRARSYVCFVRQRDRDDGRRSAGHQRRGPPAGDRRAARDRLALDDFDRIGSHVPLLVDLQPAGRFLMDDFYRAGGLLAVLREVRDLLDPTAVTVTGRPLVDYLDAAQSGTPR